jgi:uncharacterized protein YwbE
MNDPTKIDDVLVGMEVKIEKQRESDVFVFGLIIDVISKSDHPQGIFVKLENNTKGRVKEVLNSKIKLSDTDRNSGKYVVAPESTTVEYKQHFIYYHSKDERPEDAWVVEHSIYKTIAALANGLGGKLIIDIHDNGTIFGLQNDYDELARIKKKSPKSIYKPDRDGMELKIKADCKHYFKNDPKYALDLIKNISFPIVENKEICEIEIIPSYDMPLVLYDHDSPLETKKGPAFYVRKGNSSEHYALHEFLLYWVRRLKNNT